MITTLQITGPVSAVDPNGFILVGGIAFAVPKDKLPGVGQIVRLDASLSAASAAERPPVWDTAAVLIYPTAAGSQDKPAPVAASAAPAVPAAPAPVATPQSAPPRRFGAAVAAAPAATGAAQAPKPVPQSRSSTVSRFGDLSKRTGSRPPTTNNQVSRPPFSAATAGLDDDIPF